MALLVTGFWDHRTDTAAPQQAAVVTRGVGLVGTHPPGPGPRRAARAAADLQARQQMLEHRTVAGLPGTDEDHQRQSRAVDEVMDIGAQAAPGPANAVVRRLVVEIVVIRPSPLCGG